MSSTGNSDGAAKHGNIILSINSGSSSVKISVYERTVAGQDPVKLAESNITDLNDVVAHLAYIRGDVKIKGKDLPSSIKTNEDAFIHILDLLVKDEGLPDLPNRECIGYACHRVVHGGEYPGAHIVDEECYNYLNVIADLAPLHNASALAIMRACVKVLPNARNVAYFDSAFHHTMPDFIKTYPIDQDIARKNRLRKYGFHGVSYAFMVKELSKQLGKKPEDLNFIGLHLGSGASACAIKGGQSWDTSMGLTPLAGLPGATRSGDIDPSLIFHFTHDAGRPSQSASKDIHLTMAEEILNKQSGFKAMTGTTDFGKISVSDDPMCKLTFNIMCDRVSGFVGRFFVSLEGKVDALVFAGGIGEHSDRLREKVVKQCACLGFSINEEKNAHPQDEVLYDITGNGTSGIKTFICLTDEQFEMARDVIVNPDVCY